MGAMCAKSVAQEPPELLFSAKHAFIGETIRLSRSASRKAQEIKWGMQHDLEDDATGELELAEKIKKDMQKKAAEARREAEFSEDLAQINAFKVLQQSLARLLCIPSPSFQTNMRTRVLEIQNRG